MAEEKNIYEKGKIKITNVRAVFGSKTYAISDITSIEKGLIRTSGSLSLLLFITGFMFGLFGFLDSFSSFHREMWLLAVLLLIGGFGSVFLGGKPQYFIRFSSSAGEIRTYTSYDQAEIEAIVKALREAIARKG